MDTIQEMIERGKAKIEAERQAMLEQEEAEKAEFMQKVEALLADVRALFPEAIRPWVRIPMDTGDPRYSGCKYAVHISIRVDDLGMIYAMAKRHNDGTLALCKPAHVVDFREIDHGHLFLVPGVRAGEDGPEYEAMYRTYSGADDLETALALAQVEGEAFARMVERRNKIEPEPQPAPIRDPELDLQRINDSLTDAEVMAGTNVTPDLLVQIAQARALVALCDRIDRVVSPVGKNGGTRLDVRILDDGRF